MNPLERITQLEKQLELAQQYEAYLINLIHEMEDQPCDKKLRTQWLEQKFSRSA